MSRPVVAIVGRPNVGKSTLFNALAGERISIVKDTPGVTRDRIYADVSWLDYNFTMIDTGGIEPESGDVILSQMREQAQIAIDTADVIIFITDVKQGLVDSDSKVADMLRRSHKPVVLVVNKVDSFEKYMTDVYEFYNLGIGDPHPISAASMLGLGDMLDEVVKHFPDSSKQNDEDDRPRVAIVGKPNVGKSTLMNCLIGQKIAITSKKPQTTRNKIQTVYTSDEGQIVFVDTPGIHKPQQQLGRVLNKNAYSAMEDCDVIGWIVDGSQAFGTGDSSILKRIETLHKPVVLIMNKIDKLGKEQLLKRLMYWQKQYDFNDIVPISALDKDNLEELLKVFKGYLPEGEPMFPEEMKSDHDINFRMCEIVREKILFKTHEEIPHSVAVILERKEKRGNRMYLQMMVVVDRESQKGILIGKQASMIRSIRLDAQKELKDMLGCSVDLELFVRVEKNWRNHENKIKEFGLDELEQIDED